MLRTLLCAVATVLPMPALADALEAAGRSAEARAVESRVQRTGASADPRSFALFLATRGEQPTLALHLAREELAARADVYTHDAVAWAELATGNAAAAWQSMERCWCAVLAQSPLAVVPAAVRSLAHLLLPSERKHLRTVAAELQQSRAVAAMVSGENFSAVGE